MSTEVKPSVELPGEDRQQGRKGRAAQGIATREALVDAARTLFGERGYPGTSIDEVVARAGVTKGAMYHHFQGKEDLFAAVYEQIQHEVSDRVVAEFLEPDPWEALVVGSNLWIDAHLDPAVRRIVLRDARAVLGWDAVREVEARFGAVPLRGVLRRAIRKGLVDPQPLRPLALMLMGALSESCLYVADSDDPEAARAEVGDLVLRLLVGLRASSAPHL
jgi:AcrR family transcriptional regulator